MEKYKVLKNFLSEEECSFLNNWILKNKDQSFFTNAGMNGIRITTRYSKNIPFPEEAFFIKKKLINRLKLPEVKHPPFDKGMVASYASVGDTLYSHTMSDKNQREKTLNIKKGDMWCYLVSDTYHGCSLVTGKIPRTMWVFGFLIKDDIYDRLQ